MGTEALSPAETIICGRCATVCDSEDNFCRHCGMALADERLPSVRNDASVPAMWQPRLRGVAVKGAVFIAAGTLAELLVRRTVRRVLAPFTAKERSTDRPGELVSSDGVNAGDPSVESETVLLRHIRIRR